jgi:hypothetical protein
VATWAELEAAEPELAASVHRLFFRTGSGKAMLATVREGSAPRIHPISIGIAGGELLAFILRSAKLTDLETDGRYALHAHLDVDVPHEAMLRGRAHEVTDPERRAAAIAEWPFSPDETYRLFAFDIESALHGRRDSARDWPPAYRHWKA